MRTYRFKEPHYSTGGNCVVTITDEQILHFEKQALLIHKYKGMSDEEIIESFITVHHAEKVNNDLDQQNHEQIFYWLKQIDPAECSKEAWDYIQNALGVLGEER